MENHSLQRRLGLKEATSLVVGTVIGTGVFLKAATMSQNAGSPLWVLIAWLVAGLLSFTGALAYAELGSLFPKAGGEYIFLKEAYGDLFGFLFGWTRFWIGSPGSIAAYGAGIAAFASAILPLTEFERGAIAVAMITVFTALNCLSVAFGGKIQAALTVLKVFMLVGLTFLLFIFAAPATSSMMNQGQPGLPPISLFGAALLAALWAFDGWNNVSMAAGEIKDAEKNVPRALALGMALVFVLYALINISYFHALPFQEILTSHSTAYPDAPPVATKAAATVFGSHASVLLSIAFILSAIGAMNGSILTGARVPYAMAKDGLFFKRLGEVSAKSHVPWLAIVIQGIWACVLTLSGTFDQLTDYVIFASWIFYGLGAAAVIVLRIQRPDAPRAFKTPLYPFLPVVFVLCSLGLLINTLIHSPRDSLIGLGFVLVGIPFYFFFSRQRRRG
jgi:APA family basic amino acid/polyamine antiporter